LLTDHISLVLLSHLFLADSSPAVLEIIIVHQLEEWLSHLQRWQARVSMISGWRLVASVRSSLTFSCTLCFYCDVAHLVILLRNFSTCFFDGSQFNFF